MNKLDIYQKLISGFAVNEIQIYTIEVRIWLAYVWWRANDLL